MKSSLAGNHSILALSNDHQPAAARSFKLRAVFFCIDNPYNPISLDALTIWGYYNSIKTTQRTGGWIAGMQ